MSDNTEHKYQSLEGDTIRVLVGSDEKLFSVHEAIIRSSCDFFDAAMRNNWKESAERTIRLEHEEPEIFGIFVTWLYYGTLTGIPSDGSATEARLIPLFKAYVLGERLLNVAFRNALIDQIIEVFEGRPTTEIQPLSAAAATIIFAGTPSISPARRLVVDMIVHASDSDSLRY
ncbi:hypothetical protein K402DRAFT_465428 [Aulographum hederae CBS 113979]|uniref:BTB domain-containing protein n=1 Tax=Aulographum hederae CBS 113979 TaxID=1176131 RepID=A0A6G1GTC4_9PEZI|nr:hypothetical protein K402DRAFT_465428 [Aulographum hederae CBS 113979]